MEINDELKNAISVLVENTDVVFVYYEASYGIMKLETLTEDKLNDNDKETILSIGEIEFINTNEEVKEGKHGTIISSTSLYFKLHKHNICIEIEDTYHGAYDSHTFTCYIVDCNDLSRVELLLEL